MERHLRIFASLAGPRASGAPGAAPGEDRQNRENIAARDSVARRLHRLYDPILREEIPYRLRQALRRSR